MRRETCAYCRGNGTISADPTRLTSRERPHPVCGGETWNWGRDDAVICNRCDWA